MDPQKLIQNLVGWADWGLSYGVWYSKEQFKSLKESMDIYNAAHPEPPKQFRSRANCSASNQGEGPLLA